jgi:hypothetical protein
MFMTSDFGILVYIISMSNEHILISLLISVACKSVAMWIALWMLYACGKCR